MSTVRIIQTVPSSADWTTRLSRESWRNWARLEEMLRNDPKWNSQQVDSLAAESLRVLRHLHDPMSQYSFQNRGLVVGYVQSGKTANYTAVAARAVDAGYKIVIVLSGIHDSLRNQTQSRLERELAVNRPEIGSVQWHNLTSITEDFKGYDIKALASSNPCLAVVKKNFAVLTKLDAWLNSAQSYLTHAPVLLIDDEADQASINTKSNRSSDPSINEENESDLGQAPSSINALIRSILTRTTKAAYIAYTATPFANILIDPNAVDRQVGDDLFPKDFVIQLPRPEGYTGTEELFGVSAQGREVIQTVPSVDVQVLKVKRRHKSAEVVIDYRSNSLPASLSDALISFCLAGAVRLLRSRQIGQSNTMLVHVSQRIDDQERIADVIREQIELWRAAKQQGQELEGIFASVWEKFKEGVNLPTSNENVIETAIGIMQQMVVLVLNSATGENLEYDEKPGRHIVAVGGNRLSRGLTLDGLTISYFLRTASMCDTLLQMARWYGFRRGYEDLIRIWTTDGIARWFSELALVEEAMRDSITALARARRRPDEMAIRLRAHSDLLLTARNKSTTAKMLSDSWSGEHPQTTLLPLSSPWKIQTNRELANEFIERICLSVRCYGGLLARDVPADLICAFLRNYQVHEDIVAFQSDQLAEWIESRVLEGELTDWSVFVASPTIGKQVIMGGQEINLVRRRRISTESIGILTDPRHEGVDLRGGPDAYMRESGTYDAEGMRTARPSTQGLLILYPLDPSELGVIYSDVVIALALSLPKTGDSDKSWIVNRMVSNG